MILRFRRVSIAVLALLTAASACLAAAPDARNSGDPAISSSGAIASRMVDAPAAAAGEKPSASAADWDRPGDKPGYGGLGGGLGMSNVPSADDYSKFAQPRISLAANWRYTFAKSWRWQFSPGFMWAAYSKHSNPAPFTDINFPGKPFKDDWLTLMIPISAQLQLVHRGKTFTWHLGAGPGVYRVWLEDERKVIPDPVTLKLHRGVYWGGTAEIGVERFLKQLSTTSVELTLDAHYVNAKRNDQFPSGFNGSLVGVGLRIGGNYYFNLHNKPKKSSDASPPAPAK